MVDEARAGAARMTGEQVRGLDREYVIHSWAVQSRIDPLPVAGGEGAWFWDYEGRRYLDFASQVVNLNLGHQHPAVVRAIQDQAGVMCGLAPSMASAARGRFSRLLAEVAPGEMTMSFLTNGGADATENAIKLARWYTGRQKIVTRNRSYHGATGGAVSATGDPRRWPAEPGVPGVARMLDPYAYRCPAGHEHALAGAGELPDGTVAPAGLPAAPGACPVCAGAPHLEEILQYEDPESVAAVLIESVTGANGVLVPPPGYLASVRDTCSRHGVLLILDEVMSGFGRTGAWFACEHWNVVPDIMTMAKGMSAGYLPLGGLLVSPAIAGWLQDHPFISGLTSGGNPLACAAGAATIEAMRDEALPERAARLGLVLGERLAALAACHPCVGEARGLGFMWGLELVRDRQAREPLVPFNAHGDAAAPMTRVKAAAMSRGLYVMAHGNLLMVTPPLVIRENELEQGVAILDEVLAVVDAQIAGE